MDTFEKLDVNVGKSEARLTKSDYSQIVFIGIQEHYDLGAGGLDCTFELPELFSACRDDWVGIFPVGWSTTSDKICFLKVNLPDNYQSGKACTCRLQFSGLALPVDEGDFYQFCYVTAFGLVRGTSGPWQVCHASSDDFVTEEDTDEDVMIIRRRTDTLEVETNRLREDNALLGKKVDAIKADYDSLTVKYVEKVQQLQSAMQATEQMKLQLEEKNRKLESMETESRDMTVLQAALDDQIKELSQVKEALTLRVEEGMTQVRGLQDRVTQLLNEKDALEGSLKQANDEKLLLKEQLASVEEKLKQVSLEMCKVKTQAESVKRDADDELKQRDITIGSLQQALAELKAQYSEAVEKVESTRNQLEAMSKSKAMVQDECGRLLQCLQAAEHNIEDMRVQLAASEDRVQKTDAQCRDFCGKLEEALTEWASHAGQVNDLTVTLQQRDEQIATLQQEIVQQKESFVSREAEVAAAHEGPITALKQAYEQLKDRLNKEQERTKTLTADNSKLKKKLSSRSDMEVSLQREVDDLKNRLAMSAEAYTQVVVQNKMVQKELKRVRQQFGVEGDAAAVDDGDVEAGMEEVTQQLRADNARLTASLAALQDHYREEMDKLREENDKLRHKYNSSQAHCLRQLAETERLAVTGGEHDEADGPSTNHVADPMGDSAANGRAFLQAPLTPLPPPLTPVKVLPPPTATDAAAAAAPAPNADEDKFEDAVAEPQAEVQLTATCHMCNKVFTGPDAETLCFIHTEEDHLSNKCPVCDTFFEPSASNDVREQHVNSHFRD